MPRFCPRCGGLLKPYREEGKMYMLCTRCGYRTEASSKDLSVYRVSTRIVHTEKEKTVVISGSDISGLPVTHEVICPKCGYSEAYYWMIQTRAADEPPTRFYKCRRCGHTWREYE